MSRVYKVETGKRVRCYKCEVRLEKNDQCYRSNQYQTYCLKCGEPIYYQSIFRESNERKLRDRRSPNSPVR